MSKPQKVIPDESDASSTVSVSLGQEIQAKAKRTYGVPEYALILGIVGLFIVVPMAFLIGAVANAANDAGSCIENAANC